MALGTLPPQAYTRETLAKAYEWLQAQPESIRKLAQNPDSLVGLYLRAQRFGESSMEQDAPVSSKTFKADLKSLAEGLKQFDESSTATTTAELSAAAQNWDDSMAFPQVPEIPVAKSREIRKPKAEVSTSRLENDVKIKQWVEEIKEHLNLSHDDEVLKMLVKLGYLKVKELFNLK